MVAVSVTLVLVILMLRIFTEGSTAWQRNDEKLDTFREARAALQSISRDFSALAPLPRPELTATPTPAPGSSTNVPPLDEFPLLTLDHHPDTADEDKVNEEIYGILPARNEGRSSLCAIGYYCAWDQNKRAFILRRQFTKSNATFANLRGALNTVAPLNYSKSFQLLFARGLSPDEQYVDDLATYIWDFRVVIPNILENPATGTSAKIYKWPQGPFARDLPEWVEVRFKALGSNAARKMESLGGLTRDTWFNPRSDLYQKYILPNEQEFVTRIKLCR